ncbi:MAG: hypothetical protein K2X49_05080 [Acetobacteraceae bacterium]|nr:hypothetical protein [Acetobacteraceae bacterium]
MSMAESRAIQVRMSSVAEALAHIDAYDRTGGDKVAWELSRTATLARLRVLVRNPDLLNQRGLNACGPAAFFRVWLARDPLAVATYGCDMLSRGSARIGQRVIAAGWKLRAQNYANMRTAVDGAHPNVTPEHADWMLLTSLRDSENSVLDYNGEPFTLAETVAGITLPGTLAGWLKDTGVFPSPKDDTQFTPSADPAPLLRAIPTSDSETILLINSDVLGVWLTRPKTPPEGKLSLFSIPNHYVLLTGPFALSGDGAWLNIDVWTWGRSERGWVGLQRFGSGYYGMLTAKT